MTKLTSNIAEYNPRWSEMYEFEKTRLTGILANEIKEIHHIGSTSIVGLAAKPEIDILIVISATNTNKDFTSQLVQLGYRRGNDLSKGHQFYKKDVNDVRTHKIHICIDGHSKVKELIGFRNYLRANKKVREEYQALKCKLEMENQHGISEYLSKKGPFIQHVIQSALRVK
ncbi:GrpB family protein [Pseudoalteromonas sp. Of7M-16]|uniref:GrpB family protein n=1 Tax=Pseudoalteromonas sp. Of7M-16 TaxID=2917756 RepID=UPI001EF72825|nr:GrpB family protein [Pseudoalteromonas sp. Of7M-16]MCG7550533.1 GrpB family protein [Pseudoalteromonas sp. Of7M-16]